MAISTASTLLAMTAGSALLKGVGGIVSGQQAAREAKFNIQQQELEAQTIGAQSAIEEANFRRSVERLRGTQIARYGKAGVQLSGSALDVLNDTILESERDAFAIRQGGVIRQNAVRTQAALYRYSAAGVKARGYASAGLAILGGVQQYQFTSDFLKLKSGSASDAED